MMHPGRLLAALAAMSALTLNPVMIGKRDRSANKRRAKHKPRKSNNDGWIEDALGNRCFRRGRMLIHPGRPAGGGKE